MRMCALSSPKLNEPGLFQSTECENSKYWISQGGKSTKLQSPKLSAPSPSDDFRSKPAIRLRDAILLNSGCFPWKICREFSSEFATWNCLFKSCFSLWPKFFHLKMLNLEKRSRGPRAPVSLRCSRECPGNWECPKECSRECFSLGGMRRSTLGTPPPIFRALSGALLGALSGSSQEALRKHSPEALPGIPKKHSYKWRAGSQVLSQIIPISYKAKGHGGFWTPQPSFQIVWI